MLRPPPKSTLFPYTTLFRSITASAENASLSSDICAGNWYQRNAMRRSEEHTSELQSHSDLVCRLLLEKKKTAIRPAMQMYLGIRSTAQSTRFYEEVALQISW